MLDNQCLIILLNNRHPTIRKTHMSMDFCQSRNVKLVKQHVRGLRGLTDECRAHNPYASLSVGSNPDHSRGHAEGRWFY